MISAEHQAAIFARIKKIPIFATLQMEVVAFDAGYCEVKVPRQKIYDGVFESFNMKRRNRNVAPR